MSFTLKTSLRIVEYFCWFCVNLTYRQFTAYYSLTFRPDVTLLGSRLDPTIRCNSWVFNVQNRLLVSTRCTREAQSNQTPLRLCWITRALDLLRVQLRKLHQLSHIPRSEPRVGSKHSDPGDAPALDEHIRSNLQSEPYRSFRHLDTSVTSARQPSGHSRQPAMSNTGCPLRIAL
jgi:hypothetical protein